MNALEKSKGLVEKMNGLIRHARLVASRDSKLRALNELPELTPVQERERLIRQRLSDIRPVLLGIALAPSPIIIPGAKFVTVLIGYTALHALCVLDINARKLIKATRRLTSQRVAAVLDESED